MNLEAKEIVQAVPVEEAPANPNAAALVEENTDMAERVKCTHQGCTRTFKAAKYMLTHLQTHANLRNLLCRHCGVGFNVYGSRNQHEKLYCKLRPEPAENAPAKGVKRKALDDGPHAKQQRTDSPAAAPSPDCASPALPTSAHFAPRPVTPLALPQSSQFYSPTSQQYFTFPPGSQYFCFPHQSSYGQSPSSYGQPQFSYGQSQFSYGQSQSSYGQPQSSYGHPQLSNGQSQSSYGQPQFSYGQSQSSYGQPQSSYGHPQLSNGQPQFSYDQSQSNIGHPQSSYGQFANGSAQFPEPTGPSYATLQPIVSDANPMPSELCTSPPSSYSLTDGAAAQQPQFASASTEPSLEKILLDVLAGDSHDKSNDSWLYHPNHL